MLGKRAFVNNINNKLHKIKQYKKFFNKKQLGIDKIENIKNKEK